jgi:hypothetical protein
MTRIITAIYLVMLSIPAVAWAADAAVAAPVPAAATQKWWQALLIPILSALGIAVAAIVSALLLKLVRLIETKWKIDVPANLELLMTDKARLLVAWAEEQMENRLLHGDGVKTPGAERIAAVTTALYDFAKANGYDKAWTEAKCKQLAEGILHLERVDSEAVGSTGARSEALAAATPTEPK